VDSSIKNRLRERSARAKPNILLPLPYWIASLLTGLGAVAYTKLFGLGERLSFYLFHLHEWLIFIITPVCFVAAWWVVKKFAGVILVAAVSGLLGAIMSKLILIILKWKSAFKNNSREIIYVLSCAFVVALIAYFISYNILGSGKQEMSTLLFSQNKYAGWLTPGLRIIGPILSFTTGASGSIFAPSLTAGATIGALVAHWFELTTTNTNIMVLAGMVAFLTGVTRSPFTSAILVLEMTDRHNVIFHLMIAGIVAVLISSLIDKKSLYDHLKHQYLHNFNKEEKEIAEEIRGEKLNTVQ
jgi:H+/Cl- antiporter ClcA